MKNEVTSVIERIFGGSVESDKDSIYGAKYNVYTVCTTLRVHLQTKRTGTFVRWHAVSKAIKRKINSRNQWVTLKELRALVSTAYDRQKVRGEERVARLERFEQLSKALEDLAIKERTVTIKQGAQYGVKLQGTTLTISRGNEVAEDTYETEDEAKVIRDAYTLLIKLYGTI